MSKEAQAQGQQGGFLSKVVKFVSNPRTNWADLDSPESNRENDLSKAQLKEMIERKRRNDFVRKREFDMLRKIRQREAVGGGGDANARPSFFQSSMPSRPEDRSQTLKKIDEIEAQMSMQWWKTNVGSNSGPNSALSQPGALRSGNSQGMNAANAVDPAVRSQALQAAALAAAQREEAARRAAEANAQAPTQHAQARPESFESTAAQPLPTARGPIAAHAPVSPPPVAPPPVQQRNLKPTMAPNQMGGRMAANYHGEDRSTDFSHSKLFAMDVEEVDHDPELEEAAIRFANGDDAAAEAALLDALGPTGTRGAHEQTWLTLFDFYRAVGAHDSFESKALDFADRFGRSAPPWFSMPEQVAKLKPAAAPAAAAASNATWSCPSVVSGQTIVALKTALGKAQQPWHVDWGRLQTLEATALEPLTVLLRQWAGSPVQLVFSGTKQLENVLAKMSPSGDRSVSPDVWRTRMEALRVMHRADDFELVALDYCVTYEVSPPSWDAVQCSFKALAGAGGAAEGHSTIIGDAYKDSMATGASSLFGESSQTASQFQTLGQVELSGKIEGDATYALDKIEHKLIGADVMVISCAKLIRVDFGAAGSLLNWVTSRQSEGRVVQFNDVHRLVAAFFNVVGVSEHARVVTRVD